MGAKHGSLSDMMAAQLEQQVEPKPVVKRAPKAKVAKSSELEEKAAPVRGQVEIEKVTLYLPKPLYRFIKQTALELESRPHDLLMQGVEMLLAQHGKSVKDFQR